MVRSALDRMRERARRARTRAAVRSWSYRQRHLAAGVWFSLRRVLADARAAWVISDEDALQLVAEGYRPEACGGEVAPAKTVLFVDEPRLSRIETRRPIPVGLGPDFLAASAIALIAFDDVRSSGPIADVKASHETRKSSKDAKIAIRARGRGAGSFQSVRCSERRAHFRTCRSAGLQPRLARQA